MSAWDGLNRRQFPRVNCPCQVKVKADDGENTVVLTHTENIGIGGACVILKKGLKIYTPVEIELDLMDLKDHITCKGKVVWCVRRRSDDPYKPAFYDIGIEFEQLNEEDRQRLEEVVSRLVKMGRQVPYR